MIDVSVYVESRFPVSRDKLRTDALNLLNTNDARGDVAVEVLVIGDRKMKTLNKMYRNIDDTTSVLTFALEDPHQACQREQSEVAFVESPDNITRLGSVVLSYPQAVERSSEDNMMVDDKIHQLLEHGVKQLLGMNH